MLKETSINIKTSSATADSIPLKVLPDADLLYHSDNINDLLQPDIQFILTNRFYINSNILVPGMLKPLVHKDFHSDARTT